MSGSVNCPVAWSRPLQFGNDWLTNMHEMCLPSPLNSAPDGPGVFFCLALLLLYCLFRIWRVYQVWQGNRYRREATQQLRTLQRVIENGDVKAWLQLPELLRQVALVSWPRTQIVPLIGHRWGTFLSASGAGAPPKMLLELAYLPEQYLHAISPIQRQAMFNWCGRWIVEHQATAACSIRHSS